MSLESLHGLLDPMEQVTCPQDLASYWRQITSQWRVLLVPSVDLTDGFYVMAIVLKYFLILFINAKIRDLQSA